MESKYGIKTETNLDHHLDLYSTKAHLSFCNPKTNNHNQQMNQACFKTASRRLSSRKQNPNFSLGYCYCYCCSSCGSSPPTSSFSLHRIEDEHFFMWFVVKKSEESVFFSFQMFHNLKERKTDSSDFFPGALNSCSDLSFLACCLQD
jgi:hypothetical protein